MFTGKLSYVFTKSGVMQSFQTCIPFSIKDLQIPLKGALLQRKIIIKMYLIENKEVTLLVKLNR